MPSTPPPAAPPPAQSKNTEALAHPPPSLPGSPLPKRTKVADPSDSSAAPPATISSVMAEAAAATKESTPTTTKIEQEPPLLIKKLSDKARTPTRGSKFAAGYDLYSARPTTIPAHGKALIDTDLSIATPAGTYGRIAPRSGLASKHFIDTGAGVIDADYRGPVKVLLFNFSDTEFKIEEGERVAQLVLERIYTPEIVVVEELEESVRGAGGFGSTGKN